MMTEEKLYMIQPEEIATLTLPEYKHTMTGKEMKRRYLNGYKKLELAKGTSFDLVTAQEEADNLFVESRIYYLADGDIYLVTEKVEETVEETEPPIT